MDRVLIEFNEYMAYSVEQTETYAKALAIRLKRKLNKSLIDIDCTHNWFVGFINAEADEIEPIVKEFAKDKTINICYVIEKTNKSCRQTTCNNCRFFGNGCRLKYYKE